MSSLFDYIFSLVFPPPQRRSRRNAVNAHSVLARNLVQFLRAQVDLPSLEEPLPPVGVVVLDAPFVFRSGCWMSTVRMPFTFVFITFHLTLSRARNKVLPLVLYTPSLRVMAISGNVLKSVHSGRRKCQLNC